MKIKDCILCTISGDWGDESLSEDSPVKVHCLRSADIAPIYQHDYKGIPCRYVSHKSFESRELKEGDIIIEKSGGTDNCSTGRPILVTKELLKYNTPLMCSNFCCAIRIKSEWNPEYIYYYLRLIHKNRIFFNFEGKTSGIHNLDTDAAYASIDIPNISLEKQNEVSGILRNIDFHLALNRKMNEELESMVKKIFTHWFIQYDFPNSDGNPYKSSGGKMVYNEVMKRSIPYGWDVKQLSSFVSCQENGEWGDEEQTANSIEVNCVRGADINDLVGAPVRYLSNSKNGKLLKEDDIIVEISGGSPTQATGRANYVSKGILKMYNNLMTCSNFCKFIRIENKKYATYFFFLWKLFYDNGNMFHYEGKTSGIKNLQIDSLLAERWCFPDETIIEKFHSIAKSVQAKIDNNKHKSQELTELRDFLLPLLMNGQAKIK